MRKCKARRKTERKLEQFIQMSQSYQALSKQNPPSPRLNQKKYRFMPNYIKELSL